MYNGEKFLAEQLDSILAQQHDGWTLLARDDGSTDRSRELLASYQRAHPEKIRVVFERERGVRHPE